MTNLGFLRDSCVQKVSDEVRTKRIKETCCAIVEVLGPELVYVFGSAVSLENYDEDSDIDCLVVLDSSERARRFWKCYGLIRRKLTWSLDLVCLGKEEFMAKREIGGVAMIALKEGVLVYSKQEPTR